MDLHCILVKEYIRSWRVKMKPILVYKSSTGFTKHMKMDFR
jgi:hypothetical protein